MSLLHRTPENARRLDVAGLNEITVLIDRSETELTEVALNSWTPGQDGPPHFHNRKEQNFLITSGRGEVMIAGQRFTMEPGSFFYVPAGNIHQTINRDPVGRLEYFLFNAFLGSDKEGHASFADHIDKVRDTRRQQAEAQKPDSGGQPEPSGKQPRHAILPADTSTSPATLLARADTQRSEALAWNLPGSAMSDIGADATKEQTLYVVSGSGTIRVGAESETVKTGHTLYVPAGKAAALEAGANGLQVVSFGTLIDA